VELAGRTEGLSEKQIRESVVPMANPLAWLLWHIAQTEDRPGRVDLRRG
jgi:hypothetical protein